MAREPRRCCASWRRKEKHKQFARLAQEAEGAGGSLSKQSSKQIEGPSAMAALLICSVSKHAR